MCIAGYCLNFSFKHLTDLLCLLFQLVSEDNFEVQRRACVELDLTRFLKKSWQKGLPPDSISVLAGERVCMCERVFGCACMHVCVCVCEMPTNASGSPIFLLAFPYYLCFFFTIKHTPKLTSNMCTCIHTFIHIFCHVDMFNYAFRWLLDSD